EISIYGRPEYYFRQDSDRAGYRNYLAEKNYRETKGRRLIEWMIARAGRPLHNLLEIGSGFGFTRAAGKQLGLATRGVDLNPYAAQIAEAIYGFDTFTGTLAETLEKKLISTSSADAILYQFVLEHLENPEDELRVASKVLSQQGVLTLVVPNMQSVEREIFGASYRSFRRDHLWLFSPDSLNLLLERAGLRMIAMESECNIGLLRSFLTEEELRQLSVDCRAADLLVIAEKL
ncbi:MAG: class I SAM-dependent methyltransferase, partial [Acidobacteria bacterium]|nr:class I SAM-dependent methyltransferase [Acidobacteriota bacterium]